MSIVSSLPGRHSVIDRRPGHYLSFPDIWMLTDGTLLCAYREADQHVPTRRRLLVKRSTDGGITWSAPVVAHPDGGHCPRFIQPDGKELMMLDDTHHALYVSKDEGRSWDVETHSGMQHGLLDRVIVRPDGAWLTTAHNHRGTFAHPVTNQPTTEQMAYLSHDRGRSWTPHSVVAHEKNLVLCEGSMCRLGDGRILCLLRENSLVHEPMYLVESHDHGDTWSDPRPTPLIGHRPTMGLTQSGKLLITYRMTGPLGGTAAWLGQPEELDDFTPHSSFKPDETDGPAITEGGLRLEWNGDGLPPVYALRPITDPDRARCIISARVQNTGGDNGCGIRMGIWWRVLDDRLLPVALAGEDLPEGAEETDIPLTPGKADDIRFEYDSGQVDVFVNDGHAASIALPVATFRRRPVMFGALPGKDSSGGSSSWSAVRQVVVEPRYSRTYCWDWITALGQPDARYREQILLIDADPNAAWCDYGYSGWVETAPGEFYCTYHRGGGDEPDYECGKCSYVLGAIIKESDFIP